MFAEAEKAAVPKKRPVSLRRTLVGSIYFLRISTQKLWFRGAKAVSEVGSWNLIMSKRLPCGVGFGCMKVAFLFCFETRSLYVPACVGTCYVDLAFLELTEIFLLLPLECWPMEAVFYGSHGGQWRLGNVKGQERLLVKA